MLGPARGAGMLQHRDGLEGAAAQVLQPELAQEEMQRTCAREFLRELELVPLNFLP